MGFRVAEEACQKGRVKRPGPCGTARSFHDNTSCCLAPPIAGSFCGASTWLPSSVRRKILTGLLGPMCHQLVPLCSRHRAALHREDRVQEGAVGTSGGTGFIQSRVEGGATRGQPGGTGMGQDLRGLWACGRKGRDQMCLLKMSVPTQGLGRVEDVLG